MGLGGINTESIYADIPFEELSSKLDILKQRYIDGNIPGLAERKERLKKLIDIVEDNSDAFGEAIQSDFGTRHQQISLLADVRSTLSFANYSYKNVSSWMQPEKRSPNFPLNLLGAKARVHYQPYGVVGIISPWNFPVNLSIGPLVDAFAAGNAAMIKLSEFVPRTSQLVENLIKENFSESEVVVINGAMQTSIDFTKLPFDHLIYTGSTDIAKKVSSEAAKNLVPLTLELGGKSPTIVSKNADLQKSINKIMFGKLFNGGQICVSPDYGFIPENKINDFISASKEFVGEKFPTIKNNPDYTSLVHQSHYERVRGYIDDARAKGAEIIEINPANEDFSQQEHHKIPPTFVLNVNDDMEIMKNEIFGPVMPLMTYKDFDESIAYINKRPKPLAMYYFGSDDNEINQLQNRTSSGSLVVNETIFQTAQYNLPFGGVGSSGSGSYRGKDGFKNFSHKRSFFKGSSLIDATKLIFAPYDEKTEKNIKRLS